MAHYTVVASPEREKAGWKPCAILQAASVETATRQAKALRDSGGLAFVTRPARFRIRRSTRAEVQLMVAFFHSFGALSMLFGSEAERDGMFARRKKILLSFFMGLYIDPAALRRRYVDGSPFATTTTTTGSGGSETEMEESSQDSGASEIDESDAAAIAAEAEAESLVTAEDLASEDMGMSEASEGEGEFSGAASDAIDDSNQEAALAAILASPEANDGGKSRDESFDLDIL